MEKQIQQFPHWHFHAGGMFAMSNPIRVAISNMPTNRNSIFSSFGYVLEGGMSFNYPKI